MANNNIPVKIEFGGIDQISPVLGTINLRLGNLTKTTEKLSFSLKKITFASIMTMGTQVSSELQKFSSKFNGILSSSIDDSSNMEDNLNRVRILLDKKPSDNFLGGLKNQWKELSEISTMSSSEISDVSKDIVNSGEHNFKAIQTLTKLSILIADASKKELSAREGFETLNEFRNTFRINSDNLKSLADIIVYGKDQGNANFHDILESFKYAAPVLAATTNANPAQFIALAETLSQHGITGSTMGTALRKIPIQLVPNMNKNSIKKLEENGLDSEAELAKILDKGHNGVLQKLHLDIKNITDPNSGMIDLIKSFQILRKNIAKYSPAEQLSLLKQLTGTEALSTGTTLVNFLDDFILKYNDILKNYNGKAQELANSTRQTLRSEITQTKQAWDNLKISILDSSTGDSLKAINNLMKGLADSLQVLPKPLKDFVGFIGLSAYGIVQLSSALAPVMMTLYFMANTFKIIAGMSLFTAIISEIGLVITAFKTLTSVTAIWNVLSAANPYVMLFMAISTAVLLVINNFDWFKEKFFQVYNFIAPKIQFLIDKFNEFNTWFEKKLGIDSAHQNTDKNSNLVNSNEYDYRKDDFFHPEKWHFPNLFKKENAQVDIKVKFEGAPQGTKVIQKTKNAPPANVKLGYLGGSL